MILHLRVIAVLMLLICASTQAADISVNDGEWLIDYEHDIVLISNDGLNIPIETKKPTLELTHDELGVFSFSNGMMGSVTGVPVAGVSWKEPETDSTAEVFDNRPTLFISIGGAKGLGNDVGGLRLGEGLSPWQITVNEDDIDFAERIVEEVNGNHQFAYMFVDWYSSRQSRPQIKDLARYVEQFLSKRQNTWDVAIVGHSRGGILAHELSKEIVANEKINNLHTLLLDPTAAPLWGDSFPAYKASSNKTNHYAINISDDKKFIDSLGIGLTTVSDENISGYQNTSMANTNHNDITSDWLNSGVQAWIQNIISLKTNTGDAFPLELDIVDGNLIEVTIKIDHDIYLDGDVTINEDEIEIWGVVEVGPLSASQYISVNGDGAVVAANILIASAAASLNEDSAKIHASTGSEGYGASLQNKTLTVENTTYFGLAGTSFSVGEDGLDISVNILTEDITIISISDDDDVDVAIGVAVGGAAGGVVAAVFGGFGGW